MLKSRRGLLAAGLAVAVVGAIGIGSTMRAGAQQIPGDTADAPAASVAAEPSATTSAAALDVNAPAPALLPWGDRPQRVRKGRAGTTSRLLRSQGLSAADNDSDGSLVPSAEWAPKGRSAKGTFLQNEQTTLVPPPSPAASAGPSDSASASAGPSTVSTSASASASPSPTTAATTTAPASDPTSDAPTSAAPTTASAQPTLDSGGGDRTVNFLYDVGSQAAETDGIFASVTIGKPTLDKKDYHTLAEMAVQSADGSQIIEVGWNVDRVVNGDDDPHLFVFHWVNRTPTCYNACGFVQYSKSIKPGDTLADGVTKKFGIQYSNGSWWIAYDTEWVGYFPGKLWSDQGVNFSRTGFLQVFGEVAASSEKPCTQMGNGLTPDVDTAARFSSVSYVNGPTPTLTIRPTTAIYNVLPLTLRTFRYGGPGAC